MEIKLIKPKIIVSLGKTATNYLLNKNIHRFLDYHNNPIIIDDITYIPFLHPSFIIRGSYDKQKYLQDIFHLRDRLNSNA